MLCTSYGLLRLLPYGLPRNDAGGRGKFGEEFCQLFYLQGGEKCGILKLLLSYDVYYWKGFCFLRGTSKAEVFLMMTL